MQFGEGCYKRKVAAENIGKLKIDEHEKKIPDSLRNRQDWWRKIIHPFLSS